MSLKKILPFLLLVLFALNVHADCYQRLTLEPEQSWLPSVQWDGTGYAVCWQDRRGGSLFDIYFSFLGSEGEVLGDPLLITDGTANARNPVLVENGAGFLAAWDMQVEAGNYEIYARLIDAAGSPVGAPWRITDAAGNSWEPSVSFNGNGYGFSWYDWRAGDADIYFTCTDTDGNLACSEVPLVTGPELSEYPFLLWTGTGYVLVWSDDRHSTVPEPDNWEIYSMAVDQDGAVVQGPLRLTDDPAMSTRPVLAWNGSSLGLFWMDQRDGDDEIYFMDLDDQGNPQTSPLRITDAADGADARYPSVSWSGAHYGLAWEEREGSRFEVVFARIDTAGSLIGDPFRITDHPNDSEKPAIVRGNGEFGISWMDARNDEENLSYEIYFSRMTDADECEGWLAGDLAPLGDRNGAINVGDAVVILQLAVGAAPSTPQMDIAGDLAPLWVMEDGVDVDVVEVTGNGEVNVGDAVIILRLAVGELAYYD